MVMSTGNFGDLIAPTQLDIFGLEYQSHDRGYDKVFRMDNSSLAYEETLSMTGFEQVPELDQGDAVTFGTAKQNWKDRHTHLTYALGYVVTRNLFDDQFHKQIQLFPKALAFSVNDTIETTSANILNNGFDSSVKTGGDGLELLSTAHLLGGGGTYQNELTNAADFSDTSLEQALIDMGDWVTDSGLKMNAKPKMLVHQHNTTWDVQKVLDSTHEPGTPNNAVNPALKLMPSMEWVFLSDPDAWFIITNIPNGLVFYWRRMPEMTRDNDWDSENLKMKVVYRMSVGWDDPRGVFGSPGS